MSPARPRAAARPAGRPAAPRGMGGRRGARPRHGAPPPAAAPRGFKTAGRVAPLGAASAAADKS